jgi:hypothetical protein
MAFAIGIDNWNRYTFVLSVRVTTRYNTRLKQFANLVELSFLIPIFVQPKILVFVSCKLLEARERWWQVEAELTQKNTMKWLVFVTLENRKCKREKRNVKSRNVKIGFLRLKSKNINIATWELECEKQKLENRVLPVETWKAEAWQLEFANWSVKSRGVKVGFCQLKREKQKRESWVLSVEAWKAETRKPNRKVWVCRRQFEKQKFKKMGWNRNFA